MPAAHVRPATTAWQAKTSRSVPRAIIVRPDLGARFRAMRVSIAKWGRVSPTRGACAPPDITALRAEIWSSATRASIVSGEKARHRAAANAILATTVRRDRPMQKAADHAPEATFVRSGLRQQ